MIDCGFASLAGLAAVRLVFYANNVCGRWDDVELDASGLCVNFCP